MRSRCVPATFIDGPLDGTAWQVPLLGEPGRPPAAITVDVGDRPLVYSLSFGGPEVGWTYEHVTTRSPGS